MQHHRHHLHFRTSLLRTRQGCRSWRYRHPRTGNGALWIAQTDTYAFQLAIPTLFLPYVPPGSEDDSSARHEILEIQSVDPRGGYAGSHRVCTSFLSTLVYGGATCEPHPNPAENLVVNQLFGTVSGLGMGFITFDWSQITFIGSPLMVPWWAQVHVFAGFVVMY